MSTFRLDEHGQKRPCPHCRGTDYGWRCHYRSVAQTPLRDSETYWGRQPSDHNDSGLYDHGPQDSAGINTYDLTAETLVGEQMDLDPGFGERLHRQQQQDAVRNVVRYLALTPSVWGLVKLRMKLANTPRERVEEIRDWMEQATRLRKRLIDDSKREAARLRTA